MCIFFDPAVAKQCREDDAEEVREKERANFCEWFKPNESAFNPSFSASEAKAKDGLAALFGDDDTPNVADGDLSEADKLFK